MRSPLREELQWAAGLFEGEGSIYYHANKGQPRIQMNLTDEDTIKKFARVVRVGYIKGPYLYKGNLKPFWTWQAGTFEQVQAVVAFLWMGLGERRREQARITLLAYRTDITRKRYGPRAWHEVA